MIINSEDGGGEPSFALGEGLVGRNQGAPRPGHLPASLMFQPLRFGSQNAIKQFILLTCSSES